jgi:hypothetical protein
MPPSRTDLAVGALLSADLTVVRSASPARFAKPLKNNE